MFSSLPVYSCLVVLAGLLFDGVDARVVSSEGEEAGITDPVEECSPYYYAPVTNALGGFPPIWQPATLLANDTDAVNLWNKIQSSVPTNIVPHGDIYGNWNDTTYDVVADPDCWWTKSLCTTPKLAGLSPDVASVPEPETFGMGFDDGPNCSHNAFYDYLKDQNQKATMFYIGSNVLDWPYEAMRALDEGHEICAHTWSHHYMTGFSSSDAFAELYYSMKAIKLVVGVTPTCWRPPFGDVDDRIRAIAKGLGLETIIWGSDSFDWEQATGNVTADQVYANYDNLITKAENGTFSTVGSIMLTHELNNFTMQTAVMMYPQLKSAFQHIVPIGVALNKTQPYVETNYTQPNFEQYISGETDTSGSDSGSGSSSGGASSASSSSKNSGTRLMTIFDDMPFSAILGLMTVLYVW